jgi:HNH endonuclease
MPKGKSHEYTDEQLIYLESNKTMPRRQLTENFNEKFGTKLLVSAIKGLCLRKGWKTGRTGHFEDGFKPWNTGSKGVCKGSSTSFKKGNKPANLKPIGHERFCSKDGHILIKVAESNPYTSAKTRYRPKHHVVWEQEHGEIPEGNIVRFLDGNNKNCDPKNLSCVTKAVNLRMNQNAVNDLPAELKPTGKLISELEVATFNAINEKA